MNMSKITTYGPCCRCTAIARHILLVGQRRLIVHLDPTRQPCPAQAGDMPEVGEPQETAP